MPVSDATTVFFVPGSMTRRVGIGRLGYLGFRGVSSPAVIVSRSTR
jgi:hypothetical protein